MSRISTVFEDRKRKALIGYITVGYPDIQTTIDTVPLLAASGCDIIELGIPFSDPLADGVTIQNASYHALQNGVTPQKCIDIVTRLRETVRIPLLFMSYYNPVYHYGLEKFCRDAAAAGIDGLIVPDLPPDEGTDLESFARAADIDLVYLAAPTSTESRVKMVVEKSRGFIYLVSVAGVTGARNTVSGDLDNLIRRIRKMTAIPVCIGFGISTAEQAAKYAGIADGVIVGSRFIQLLETGEREKLENFTKELRRALDKSAAGM